MLIDRIILKDFRIYQGVNEVLFLHNSDKNVTIIAGNNGYGKTTFLTSLVWCLYGKLMVDVDERFRKEIYESGGYKRFCRKVMNRATRVDPEKEVLINKLPYLRGSEEKSILERIDSLSSFSVTMIISDIFIPSVPCNRVEITRTFNVDTEEESVQVLIDGRENELTREVGPEIFIHDFIMPKEIAKFFFFDAEKIVSLAEIRTVQEKKELSKAYSEVLGIKKYEDLKTNLENIRLRLRKSKATDGNLEQLQTINKKISEIEKLQTHYREKLLNWEEDYSRKKYDVERLQEKLIREGSSITIEELDDLRKLTENTLDEQRKVKNEFKDFLELAPFAIAANKLAVVHKQIQLEEEEKVANLSTDFLREKISSIEQEIEKNSSEMKLTDQAKGKLKEILLHQLIISNSDDFKPLLDFSSEQLNVFRALHDKLQNAYSARFKSLVHDVRMKQSSLSILMNKIRDAETKENDVVIQEIRKDKEALESELLELEEKRIQYKVKLETSINELKSLSKRQAELSKKVEIADLDLKKDQTAARLINELTGFLQKLKIKKKESLELNVLLELQKLMHKQDFISRVEVVLEDDILDIYLFDDQDHEIDKESLSKGEQQLYATALLKALVDESNIKFPIFIDRGV